MANRTCSIAGCDRQHYGRGYCGKHYTALIRRKQPRTEATDAAARDAIRRHSSVEGECWIWQGSRNRGGYGNLSANLGDGDRPHLAHRVSYVVFVGEIGDGKQIDHRCRVRACVNPAHLRPCVSGENMENRSGAYGVSGIRGVYPRPNGKWRVQVQKDRVFYGGGTFTDINEAAEAARALRLRLFTHNEIDRT